MRRLTSFYGVYRCIRHRTGGTRNETNNHVLVGRELRKIRLPLLNRLLQLLVHSKVGSLVRRLSKSSKRDTAI